MKYFFALFLIVIAGMATSAHAQQSIAIAAVVNDEAISMTDVTDRMKLVMVSSGLPNNPEIRAKIQPQVIEGLIEDQLKMQEARRNKIEITEEEVMDGVKIIAEQNKYDSEQFLALLVKSGVPKSTLLGQIRAQLAWNKVVKDVLRRQVEVKDTDVDQRIARLQNKVGQTEYLVAEIYLPLDQPKRNAETMQFAQRMAKELQEKKVPFGPVAAQFSKAAGAEKGGNMGWIQAGYLDGELDKVLLSMGEETVSNPIKSGSGLYILNLIKKRTLTEESIPPREELMNAIGFERLDRAQQRTLLDLKSAAFIDRRV